MEKLFDIVLIVIEKLYYKLSGKQDSHLAQIQWQREERDSEINRIFEEGHVRVKGREYEVAKERFIKFLSYRRDSIEGHIALALVYSQLEEYEASLNFFADVLKLAQANGTVYINEFREIWFAHGMTHFKLKQYESAITCYKKSLRIDPSYANAKREIEKCEFEIARVRLSSNNQPPFLFGSSTHPSGLLGSSPFSLNSTPKLSAPSLSDSSSSSTKKPPRESERPPSVQKTKDQFPLPVLKRGMKSPNVMRLQERLRELGFFKGEIDGIFGDQTLEAVKRAQRSYNLTPDGIVGSATWGRLGNL